jgi:ribosomal protein S18 acetylase RimI-like enzyme
MLCAAFNWCPERPRRTLEDVLADPHGNRYLHNWGRHGDTAVIAVAGCQPVGAAWYRLFSPEEPGYGFSGSSTPELSIGVIPGFRGRGIGGALLTALLQEAENTGFSALSLSVEPHNHRAVALYERYGFTRVGEYGGAWTMRRDLGLPTGDLHLSHDTSAS